MNKRPVTSEAYNAGFDAGTNGANTTNSHFSYFATEESKKEWDQGFNEAWYGCENPKTIRQAIRFDTAPNGDTYVSE